LLTIPCARWVNVGVQYCASGFLVPPGTVVGAIHAVRVKLRLGRSADLLGTVTYDPNGNDS
jgi:hypothetical protein